MQRSFLDYAMSVIVSRALPDVRDGLKPVHRRVLYAMYDGGYRPDRGYSKCSRVVGDVMGQYHPHGDSAIYDTLVRLAQPWSMRLPLVDGQGNFGSPGNDPPAAMRYSSPATPGSARRWVHGRASATLVPDAVPNSDNAVDLKVLDRNGDPVAASMLFHSGRAPHASAHAPREGYALTGTHNHPVLCLVAVGGVPTLLWKLAERDLAGRPRRALPRRSAGPARHASADHEVAEAILAGAWVSEGFVCDAPRWLQQHRPARSSTSVVAAFDARRRRPALRLRPHHRLGSRLFELDVQNLAALAPAPAREVTGKAR